jgi:O-antigen/teichoic acid export membrane protein
MPLLIRRFGLAEYGVYLLAGSLSAYLSLLDFGVGTTIVKHTAEFRAKGDRQRMGELVSTILVYYVFAGIVASVVLLAFSQFGVFVFRLDAERAHLASSLFRAAAGIALFAWPLSVGAFVLNGLQRYDLTARVGSLVVLGNIAATAVVLLMGEGPLVLLVANGAVGLVGSSVCSLLASRQLPGVRPSHKLVTRAMLGMVFGFSSVIFVTQIANTIIYQQTDRIVLGVFVGATSIAMYEAAAKMNGLVGQLVGMPAAALMPAASELDALERVDTLRTLFMRGAKYSVVFVAPIVAGLMVLSRPLLEAWLGSTMATQAPVAVIFVSFWLLWVNVQVPLTILVGMGRLRFYVWLTIAQAAINITLSLLLVQRYQVLGVVLGTVLTNYALFPITMRYCLRVLQVPVREYLTRVVLPTYPLLVVPVAVAAVFRWLGVTDSLLGVAVAGLSAVGLYWVMIALFALDTAERLDLQALVAAGLRRLGVSR